MGRFFRTTVAALAIIFCSGAIGADLTVGTWNIKRLGHGNQTSFKALAHVARHADLIAVQEVMNEGAVDRLVLALENATGDDWSAINSHLIGNSYKEMYSFVYNERTVSYEDGAVVYLDRGNKFIREPFSARFRSRQTGDVIAVATVHILYGKGVGDRLPEIIELDAYWNWLGEVYPGTPRMLMGDFNLDPHHQAWSTLRKSALPLITEGASTLSSINGRYANLYDNVYVSKETALPIRRSVIVDFPKLLGWDHEKSRAHVSDHAPIFVTLGQPAGATNLPVVTDQTTKNGQRKKSKEVAASAPNRVETSASAAYKGAVRGNRNSSIFHRPDCPSYASISPHNIVLFNSGQEAIAGGYRLAGNCP
ncbi:Ada metal-binding domain-containing protein (plasmid) [Halopseudomonas sp. SMJS2]|uniref:Ada metal-binding domain-containing protein n=1 Tax=Halopseudomonas sp. SMJS2 TaxID=3041098 RepID=UPI0024529E07|nr:Ada metal-binding domain-containing protein [Halopseudomonas sp. SMJS2]WGK63338.1 Ada metal-binding domain-containing protein [Halopseudomonas sp. SMJS2]